MAEPKHPTDDPAPALDSLDAIAAFLVTAFDAGDVAQMTSALAVVARAKGLPELAAAAGLPREQLAQALAAGELSLDDTLAIMKVVDLHMPGK